MNKQDQSNLNGMGGVEEVIDEIKDEAYEMGYARGRKDTLTEQNRVFGGLSPDEFFERVMKGANICISTRPPEEEKGRKTNERKRHEGQDC